MPLTVSCVLGHRRGYTSHGNWLPVSPVRRFFLHGDAFRGVARSRVQLAVPVRHNTNSVRREKILDFGGTFQGTVHGRRELPIESSDRENEQDTQRHRARYET